MGRIALPNLTAQAAVPLVASLLLGVAGTRGTFTVLIAICAVNLMLSALLFRLARPAARCRRQTGLCRRVLRGTI